MKATIALILLIISLVPEWKAEAQSQIRPIRAESMELFGRRYVRLADWAKASGFEARWLKRDQLLQLTDHSSRLIFAVDSKEAELNGVKVWLSYPIALRNGSASIAETDLETAIRPVLSPPRNWKGSRIRKIVLDPGHGGKEPGFQEGAHQEKKYTLLLAQELQSQLKRAGFNASLTRTTDALVDLPDRPEIARRRGADLFISLHWNSAGAGAGRNEVKGVETYCLTPAGASSTNAGDDMIGAGTKPGNRHNEKNFFLAWQLQKSLLRDLGVEDRGVRRARFSVLRTAEMPAVLIEGGFMSHPAESRRIYDPAYRRQMARAIVEGVMAYKRQVEGER